MIIIIINCLFIYHYSLIHSCIQVSTSSPSFNKMVVKSETAFQLRWQIQYPCKHFLQTLQTLFTLIDHHVANSFLSSFNDSFQPVSLITFHQMTQTIDPNAPYSNMNHPHHGFNINIISVKFPPNRNEKIERETSRQTTENGRSFSLLQVATDGAAIKTDGQTEWPSDPDDLSSQP